MKVLINALPVTNLSGRHVVLGLLKQLLGVRHGNVDYVVLHHASNQAVFEDLKGQVSLQRAPRYTAHWVGRAIWELFSLPRLIRREGADLLLMTSGTVLLGDPVPQVTLAMNPWCFAPDVHVSIAQRIKACLQRHAYRESVRKAAAILYLSGSIRDAYHRNAGMEARRCRVVYTPLQDDVWPAVEQSGAISREAGRIICVSAMAPHKGVETLIDAVADLRNRHGRVAKLVLAGAWPDSLYEQRIRSQINRSGLEAQVEVRGHLPRPGLLDEYARSMVFALLSRCESFGIPGAEAQAFGTPVLCSDAGAMAEVYGKGACVVPVGDVKAAADALESILGNAAYWECLSGEARVNARRFMPQPGEGLVSLFEEIVKRAGGTT